MIDLALLRGIALAAWPVYLVLIAALACGYLERTSR